MAMLDKAALIQRAIAWEKAHAPNTGYTEKVFRAVCGANLENGENLLTQIAAQFTGKEESVDEVHWDAPEDRLDYSNTYRYSLDRSTDCSSTWYVLMMIFFGINIGTWTEGCYSKYKKKQIPWAERRIGDIVLWNFKEDEGRHVSHEGCIMVEPDRATGKGGLIGHTTSPKNPFRFEADDYSTSHRVGVFRVLTDEQYQSLFITDHKETQPVPTEPEQPVVYPVYRYEGATYTNFRETAAGKDIGDIHHGDTVEKLGSKAVDGTTWWKVRFKGKEGWCANGRLFVLVSGVDKPAVPTPEPTYPKFKYNGATMTNFRSQPKVAKDTDIGDIHRGDIIEKISEKQVGDTTWWNVRFQGKTGWCANTGLFIPAK